jgi:hypothetical protein
MKGNWKLRGSSIVHGWDLQVSLVADRVRLKRFLLALVMAIWWVIHLAASCIHHGKRDRFDWRDKSLLRLGCLWLKDILRHSTAATFAAATLTCCLPFRQTAPGWRFSLRLPKSVSERASPPLPDRRMQDGCSRH